MIFVLLVLVVAALFWCSVSFRQMEDEMRELFMLGNDEPQHRTLS